MVCTCVHVHVTTCKVSVIHVHKFGALTCYMLGSEGPTCTCPIHQHTEKGENLTIKYTCMVPYRMGRRIYGALVQFGCYRYRHEWKGLWCSNTVWLLSTQT